MQEFLCNPICVSHRGEKKCKYHEPNFIFKLDIYDFKKGNVYRRPILRNDALFIVIEGVLNIEVDGEPLTVRKNEMVLLPIFSSLIINTEEDSRGYIQAFKSGAQHICINRKILSDKANLEVNTNYKIHSLPINNDLRQFVEVAMKQITRFRDCNLMYHNKLHELGMYLSDDYSANELVSFLRPILYYDYEFIGTLNAGIEDFRTVSDIIEWTGMEEEQLNASFKKMFQCEPEVWLNNARKQVILQYIIQRHCNASNVVVRFGFSSKDHLDHYCKNNYREGIDRLVHYYSNYPFKID